MIPENRKSTHPGEILLEEFLRPLGITQVAFAEASWDSGPEDQRNRERQAGNYAPDRMAVLSGAEDLTGILGESSEPL